MGPFLELGAPSCTEEQEGKEMAGVGWGRAGTELLSLLMMPLDSGSCSLVLALGPSLTSWGSSSFFWRFWEGSGILKCVGDHGKKTGPAPGRLLGRGGWHLPGVYSTPRLPAWGVHAVAWKPTNPSSYQPLGGLCGPRAPMQGSAHVGRRSTCTSVSNL